jgi:hypothetical protein
MTAIPAVGSGDSAQSPSPQLLGQAVPFLLPFATPLQSTATNPVTSLPLQRVWWNRDPGWETPVGCGLDWTPIVEAALRESLLKSYSTWTGLATATTNQSKTLGVAPRNQQIWVNVVRPQVSSWPVKAVNQLEQLLALRPNWDTHGGQPISARNANAALTFLYAVMAPDTSSPSIVPTHNGGVQLEWHRSGLDVEALFAGGADDGLYVRDVATGDEWEGRAEEGFRQFGLSKRLVPSPAIAPA